MNPDSHCRSFITPQIQYRSIIIDYLFRGFITCFANPLSVSQNHYFCAHSLFFRPFTVFNIVFAHWLPFSRIHHLFREFNILFANSLSFSQIHYLLHEFTICSANSLSISSVSRIQYLFREFTIYFANPLSVFSLSRYMMTQIKRYAYYVTLCLRNSLNDSYESYNRIKKCLITFDDSYKRDDNVI